jgi:hypothetical protein
VLARLSSFGFVLAGKKAIVITRSLGRAKTQSVRDKHLKNVEFLGHA